MIRWKIRWRLENFHKPLVALQMYSDVELDSSLTVVSSFFRECRNLFLLLFMWRILSFYYKLLAFRCWLIVITLDVVFTVGFIGCVLPRCVYVALLEKMIVYLFDILLYSWGCNSMEFNKTMLKAVTSRSEVYIKKTNGSCILKRSHHENRVKSLINLWT